MSVRVKICGVTRVEDARLAWAAGADALGLNFYPRSPRYVTPEQAAALARTRPGLGTLVGVFVNETPDVIRARVRDSGLTAVQLHGDEPPEACQGYGVPVIKALRVRTAEDVERAAQELVRDAFRAAHGMLTTHRGLLEEGARRLLEAEALERDELDALFGPRPEGARLTPSA